MTTAEDRPVKQVIVIRRDLNMRRGKEIAQGAHASSKWLANRIRWAGGGLANGGGLTGHVAFTLPEALWLQNSFTKVTCQVPGERELLAVLDAAEQAGVMACAIEDAGRTEFGGRITLTAVAVGPDWADLIDKVTGQLTLY